MSAKVLVVLLFWMAITMSSSFPLTILRNDLIDLVNVRITDPKRDNEEITENEDNDYQYSNIFEDIEDEAIENSSIYDNSISISLNEKSKEKNKFGNKFLKEFVNVRVTDGIRLLKEVKKTTTIIETMVKDDEEDYILEDVKDATVLGDVVNIRVINDTNLGNVFEIDVTTIRDEQNMVQDDNNEEDTKGINQNTVTENVKTTTKVIQNDVNLGKDIEVEVTTTKDEQNMVQDDNDEEVDKDINLNTGTEKVKTTTKITQNDVKSQYSSCVSVNVAHIGKTLETSFPLLDPWTLIPPKFTVEECWKECKNHQKCKLWNYVDQTYGGIIPERFIGSCYLKTGWREETRSIKGYVAGGRDCYPIGTQ